MARTLAALFSAAMLLGSSTDASASCGNYLFQNGRPVAEHAMRSSSDSLPGSVTPAMQRIPPEIPLGRCTGPHCSGRRQPVTPVSVPTSLVKFRDQPVVVESFVMLLPDAAGIEIPTSEFGAHFEPTWIFRPPAAA